MHKKIAFIGSVGCGKTTIINQLSTIDTVNTDVKSSVDIGKDLTTVGIDYGHIALDEDLSLGLYGVPGQRRFSFIWDHVMDGLWGVVILVKHDDNESLEELSYLMNYFKITSSTPCVIGISHADKASDDVFRHKVMSAIMALNFNFPVYTVDARSEQSATIIMQSLIALGEI
ncbi:MAG: ATP/GTP-binding protein [Alcanivoracaceae bacterium]|nr:ATP/GTP-binding protein [Alcanivoracaceae bacterium]